MTRITTIAGDDLDALLAEHYGEGTASAALAVVLAANPGLARLGPSPPAGTAIRLPSLPPAPDGVRLWN